MAIEYTTQCLGVKKSLVPINGFDDVIIRINEIRVIGIDTKTENIDTDFRIYPLEAPEEGTTTFVTWSKLEEMSSADRKIKIESMIPDSVWDELKETVAALIELKNKPANDMLDMT
ncbi:MAG: hypothetical protein JKX72_04865 [Robiginitomaculum sp.]|nr:hypothetical protein [Robiginitomaculum sp.]